MQNLPDLLKEFKYAIDRGVPDKLYYFHANHLGSGSLITDKNGGTYQTLAYAPWGEDLANIRHYGDWYDEVRRFTGYEKDNESNLSYAEARYYDDGWFKSVDPLAEKYPNISPYAYCHNNPVMNVDPDGREVIAVDIHARRNITNTLSSEEAQYVRFNDSGTLDVSLLNQHSGTSENFTALHALANSETKYIFAVANQDINGSEFFEVGGDLQNPTNFAYGVTNLPGAENDPSPNGNVYIFTASFLDEKTQTRNTAHEGYGHAYFFELSKSNPSINPNHTKSVVGSGSEYDPEFKMDVPYFIFGQTNTALENQIKAVEQQAIKNYEDKNP
jgi:RHS repeat-associated protein